jgi:hypothetical protein
VNISKHQVAERIPLQAKIDLQVLFASVPNPNLSGYSQQNWPMKNDQKPNAYCKANPNAAPDVAVWSFLGLISLSHRTTLLPAMSQGKGQLDSAVPGNRHFFFKLPE